MSKTASKSKTMKTLEMVNLDRLQVAKSFTGRRSGLNSELEVFAFRSSILQSCASSEGLCEAASLSRLHDSELKSYELAAPAQPQSASSGEGREAMN